MNEALILSLIEQAMLAPSVHNVQPARWRIDGDTLILIEDVARRLSVGDPTGHDAAISLGAAMEGLRLAASCHGLTVTTDSADAPSLPEPYRFVTRCRFAEGGVADPLADFVQSRTSYRASFAQPDSNDVLRVEALSASDATIVADPIALTRLARQYDAASYGFMQQPGFRQELLSWMRLSQRHPDWARDGLNADAMALGRLEALGAGLVLGPLFTPLHRMTLAPSLLAEGVKLAEAAAVVLFHRPADENPLESGAAFYRLWLRIEQAGFGAAVLAALADDRETAAALQTGYAVPPQHRLVSAFRIGRRKPHQHASRARLPLEEIVY